VLWTIDSAHRGGVTALCLSHNRRFLLTGGSEGDVSVNGGLLMLLLCCDAVFLSFLHYTTSHHIVQNTITLSTPLSTFHSTLHSPLHSPLHSTLLPTPFPHTPPLSTLHPSHSTPFHSPPLSFHLLPLSTPLTPLTTLSLHSPTPCTGAAVGAAVARADLAHEGAQAAGDRALALRQRHAGR
jgi:hypothetical protein